MTTHYMMRKKMELWREVDKETFYRHLHGEIIISPTYDLEKALRRATPMCGARHLFKITEDNI